MNDKKEIKFYMKSGNVITVIGRDLEIESSNNELSSYEITEIDNSISENPLYIRIDEVEAITYKNI